jgi:carbon storage regulator CsrA
MLVLSRQRDESVMINDDVEIRVVDVRGDKVRLGFVAPRTVSIHRKEIYDTIRRENQSAATMQPQDLPTHQQARDAAAGVAAEPEPMLEQALAEARVSVAESGMPIGCVIARDQQVLARAHDRRLQDGVSTRQAAILAIERAGEKLPADATVYLTTMPTLSAAAALIDAGASRVVVGDARTYGGGKVRNASAGELLRAAGVTVVDRRSDQCSSLLAEFIREKPDAWKP